MSIRVALHHKTSYAYDRAIELFPQVIRLRPAAHSRTRILSYSLKITPAEHFLNWQQDPGGNFLARVVIPERTREFSVTVDLVADLAVFNPFDFFIEPQCENFPFEYEPRLALELRPFLETRPLTPELAAWLEGVNRTPRRMVDFIVELNHKLAQDINYVIRMEPGVQTPEDTLRLGKGSCRDSAWLMVQILRNLGLAARFVSGYLIQLKPDEPPLEGPPGPDRDFTDLHAWSEVYIPGAGWIGLDSTSGLLAAEGHIPLAATAEPSAAAPISGGLEPAETTFHFEMSVQRLDSQPTSLRPYTDSTWEKIDRLGRQVDEDLQKEKIKLTTGGEPTFVFLKDPDSPEWNLTADGGRKKEVAARLLYRLAAQFSPGGMLFHGQGKWYPGEPLPRWALSSFFRRDGKPLWNRPERLARLGETYTYQLSDAKRLLTKIAERLGLDAAALRPAVEDVFYDLWTRGKFYGEHPAEALREAKRIERGYVLPLRYMPHDREWISCLWPDAEHGLFLIPGDSSIGYRLPLSRLPPDKIPGIEFEPIESPLAPPGELPDGRAVLIERGKNSAPRPIDPKIMMRTALCVEVRDGALCVFFPPMTLAEGFLELAAAIELATDELGFAVFFEGYEPPPDYRIRKLAVTPDPGVVEVNIHPAHDWLELRRTIETLYESAKQEFLGAEKFMHDGRPVGTGGGNHITLGGPSPAESPFLRNPALLRSMITYWQHHPALSYVFSGLFVGPTSQAPRIDEARHESLYELEIAFKHLPGKNVDELKRPWLVDRLLRNILVDITGNTHRAEFCIDKLYPPDRMELRLGLVEFRAFEMPPHPRMYMACMLLMRALVARFWREPYEHRLVRWGTDLTDRFVLPHFLHSDFQRVIEDLRRAGYAFEMEFFEPFFEFRFPIYGSTQIDDVQIELRMALEPWPVLGEISWLGATTRPVDSAVERLQVRVSGMIPDRHVLLCNGRRLPLYPTENRGEFVAGVRYKAWNPPNTLHPEIQVHTPLVFDLCDAWQGRSLGGCTYHVAHPGGRAYETAPVNANEAESRRESRFFRQGHTPGPIEIPPAEPHPEYPRTLDLRLQAP